MSRPERDLLLYFMDILSDKLGCAGCNDMDQAPIDALDPVARLNLYRDFLDWDSKANPDGWESSPVNCIPDFSWVGFLKAKLRAEVTQ